MPSLSLSIAEAAGAREIVVGAFPAAIGRDGRCRVRIDAQSVSGLHCTLHRVGDRFFVMDNRSSNGTAMNGKRVGPGCLKALQGGARLLLGSVQVTVSVVAAAAAGGTRTRFRELLGGVDISDAGAGAFVVVLNGPDAGRSLALEGPHHDAGRGAGVDLPLNDRRVSTRHCRLARRGRAWTVEDLKSRNGTYLNGARTRKSVALQDGDIVVAGESRLMFITRAGEPARPEASAGPRGNRRAAVHYLCAAFAGFGSIGAAAAIMYCLFS